MSDLAKVWDVPAATCPAGSIGHDFRPFDHHAMHATLARAREAEPVFYSPELGYWVVTRYADILDILRDPDRFSAANANTPISPLPPEALQILQEGGYALEGVQVNVDPPKHTRIRAVASQAMGMKRFVGMEPDIRRMVREMIEAFRGEDRVDLMPALTYGLPARTIFTLLGIPDEDVPKVKAWATDRLLLSFSRPTRDQQIEAARNLVAFWNYCVGHVARRVEDPQDDYASDLLRLRGGDDNVLTLNEVNSIAFGLLFAGHETTTSQVTNTLNALLSEPGLWDAVVADPGLIPNAVEEGLRMYGAVANWRRIAKEDVEIAGIRIPAGGPILMSFCAANRDPGMFPDPDRFRLDRPNSRRHLTFGNGIHTCLGAPLSRIEMKVMIEELAAAFPRLRRAPGHPVDYAPAFAFRVPDRLWVDLRG